MGIDRRIFLLGIGAGVAAAPAFRPATKTESLQAIDTTPHVWNPKRSIGVPWRPEGEGVSARQLKETAPKEVVGAVVVECSPWLEDNLWLLDAVADEPFVVGVVGNLRPDDKGFGEYVERYNRHPLYLGIRHGNIWPGYDLPQQIKNPLFLEGLKLLAQADLALDLANPRMDLLEAAVRINDAAPDLRVIVDHLGVFRPKQEEWPAVDAILREYAQRPNIYGKLSALRPQSELPPDQFVAAERERLDRFYEAFGEDRIFGGAYLGPNALPYSKEYLAGKSPAAQEKFFWKNSARIYKWTPRTPEQPSLA